MSTLSITTTGTDAFRVRASAPKRCCNTVVMVNLPPVIPDGFNVSQSVANVAGWRHAASRTFGTYPL